MSFFRSIGFLTYSRHWLVSHRMPIELKTPTWRDRKKLLFGLVAVCYLDIVASIVQWRCVNSLTNDILSSRLLEEYLDIHAGLPAVWRGFSDLIRFSTDFAGSTGDVVFLSLMRFLSSLRLVISSLFQCDSRSRSALCCRANWSSGQGN